MSLEIISPNRTRSNAYSRVGSENRTHRDLHYCRPKMANRIAGELDAHSQSIGYIALEVDTGFGHGPGLEPASVGRTKTAAHGSDTISLSGYLPRNFITHEAMAHRSIRLTPAVTPVLWPCCHRPIVAQLSGADTADLPLMAQQEEHVPACGRPAIKGSIQGIPPSAYTIS